MASVSDLVIRRAWKEDHAAVMDIDDNIYDGFDYLPVMYERMVRDENSYMLLAELSGKVVGFTNFVKVGPNAVVAMAARTRPSYRGRGIVSKLYKASIQQYLGMYGKPILEYRSTMLREGLGERISTKQHCQIARQWKVLRYKFSLDIIPKTWSSGTESDPASETRQASHQELSDPQILNQLNDIAKLGGNLFAYGNDWIPLEANSENISKVVETVDTVLVTWNYSQQGEKMVTVFSLTSVCPVKNGLKVDIWCFSNGCPPDVYTVHVRWIMRYLRDKHGPEAAGGLFVHFPASVPWKDIDVQLRPVLGERYSANIFSTTSAVVIVETHYE